MKDVGAETSDSLLLSGLLTLQSFFQWRQVDGIHVCKIFLLL